MAIRAIHRVGDILYRSFVRCSNFMFHLSEFLQFLVMVIIVYEVVMRYFFNSPTIWVVDVSRYCVVYITFLGATALLLRGEHITLDLVVASVNEKSRLILDIIGHAVSGAGFLVFFLFGVVTTWEHYARGTPVVDPIEIPKAIPLAIIPIGAFFLCIGCIARIGEFWRRLKNLPRTESVTETTQ